MTYIIVQYGDDGRLLANAHCCAGVLRDWLLDRLRHLLPSGQTGGWRLDLCSADGSLRLLSALPARCSSLEVLSGGGTVYRAAVRSGEPGALFQWLGGAPDTEQRSRLVRDQLAWELAALRIGADAAPELVLQTALQVLASPGTSVSLARQLARVAAESRTARLEALEQALGPQRKAQQAVQAMKQQQHVVQTMKQRVGSGKGRPTSGGRVPSAKSTQR